MELSILAPTYLLIKFRYCPSCSPAGRHQTSSPFDHCFIHLNFLLNTYPNFFLIKTIQGDRLQRSNIFKCATFESTQLLSLPELQRILLLSNNNNLNLLPIKYMQEKSILATANTRGYFKGITIKPSAR